MENENPRPFWALEYDYLKARELLESRCWSANMTILIDQDGDAHQVGYLEEDADFEIYDEDYEGQRLSDIPVEFDTLDRDEDGYTIAIFRLTEKSDETK